MEFFLKRFFSIVVSQLCGLDEVQDVSFEFQVDRVSSVIARLLVCVLCVCVCVWVCVCVARVLVCVSCTISEAAPSTLGACGTGKRRHQIRKRMPTLL